MAIHVGLHALFLIVLFTSTALGEIEADGSSVITLSHSFGTSGVYEPRGQITVKSLRSGSLSIYQDSSLSWEDFKEAAANDRFYQLEAVVRSNGVERTFLTSTKACLLFESRLSDIITIHVDLLGNIYGLSIAVPPNQQCMGDVPVFDASFNTTVLISYMENGPVPDVAMYVQKIEQEKVAKERGETKDNRSFFAKYWMYILPIVLVVMMSGANNPEQGASR